MHSLHLVIDARRQDLAKPRFLASIICLLAGFEYRLASCNVSKFRSRSRADRDGDIDGVDRWYPLKALENPTHLFPGSHAQSSISVQEGQPSRKFSQTGQGLVEPRQPLEHAVSHRGDTLS